MPEQVDAAKGEADQALTEEEVLARLLSSRPEPSILERERAFERVMTRVDTHASFGARVRLALRAIAPPPAMAAAVTLAAAGGALWLWSNHEEQAASSGGGAGPVDMAVWWASGNTSPYETRSPAALETPSTALSAYTADETIVNGGADLFRVIGDWSYPDEATPPAESSGSVVHFPGESSIVWAADVAVPVDDTFSPHKAALSPVLAPFSRPRSSGASLTLACLDVPSGSPVSEPSDPVSCSQDGSLSITIEAPSAAPYVAVMATQLQKPERWLSPAAGEETGRPSLLIRGLADMPAGEYEITLAFFEQPLSRTEVVQQLRKSEAARARVLTRKLTVTPGPAWDGVSVPTIP